MDKIRRWFNKQKKDVGNLLIQPLSSDNDWDVTMVTEMRPSPQQQRALPLNDRKQADEENLKTMFQTAAPLPVRLLLQVEHLTVESKIYLEVSETINAQRPGPDTHSRSDSGGLTPDTSDIITLRPSGVRSSNTSASSPGLPVRPILRPRDDFSILSSPDQGTRGWGPPCSLPCSPLLLRGRWRSSPCSPISPSPSPGLSRLWVEAALQRSKDLQQTKTISPQSKPIQSTSLWGGNRVERGKEEQSDEEEEEKKVSTDHTVIVEPTVSPPCGRQGAGREVEELEDSDLWCLDPVKSTYCHLTPCDCLSCPSAPPYEDQVFSARDMETVSLSSVGQRHDEGSTTGPPLQWVRGGNDSPCLYPSLSLCMITGDLQTEQKRKRDVIPHPYSSCSQSNPMRLARGPGEPGEPGGPGGPVNQVDQVNQ